MSFLDEFGETSPAGRDRPGGRVALLVIVAVLVFAGAGWYGLVRNAQDVAPRLASVEGVDIGGLTSGQAYGVLNRQLGARLGVPVVFTHHGRRVSIVPRDAGISIDYLATTTRAGIGDVRTPKELWDHYTGGADTDAVLRVDTAAMSRVLDSVTESIDSLAVEGTLDFTDGRARAVYGKAGQRVDREATIAAVESAVFGDRQVLALPVETRDPYITGTAVQRALKTFGRPAMSASVTLVIGPERVVVPPEIVGRALTMIPSSGTLKPLLDGDRLMELMKPHMKRVGDTPRNASIKVVDGALVLVPARVGAAWDEDELEDKVLAALTKPAESRVVQVKAALKEPNVDDAEVASWGITRRLAQVDVGVQEAPQPAVKHLNDRRIPAGGTFEVGGGAYDDALLALAPKAGLTVAKSTRTLANPGPGSVLISVTRSGSKLHLEIWGTPTAGSGPTRTDTPRPAGR